MRHVRVVAVGLPRILRDLLFALIDAAPDVEIVGESSSTERLSELLSESRADVLLLGAREDPSRRDVCELLAAHDGLRMVTVALNGRAVRACEVSCRAVEPSPQAVLEEVRRVPARSDTD